MRATGPLSIVNQSLYQDLFATRHCQSKVPEHPFQFGNGRIPRLHLQLLIDIHHVCCRGNLLIVVFLYTEPVASVPWTSLHANPHVSVGDRKRRMFGV
mmetsp:Transcript_5267/g.8090  ORF Transcript_5267/g.8090 Transcript_5267/m.8090 type:complete len:98 (+) Transcript_5267:1680-1973(+)